MASVKEIKVPNIGDFNDVDVIEVLAKPGDRINPEDSLITLESDKATMEVPSPEGGIVKDVLISVGDKVSEGIPILTLETVNDAEAATAEPPTSASEPTATEPPEEEEPLPEPSPPQPSVAVHQLVH
ncbi:MAG: branched-chain alpha-keto acid dehydrogenase subunit E2, partial [Nitrococcus mobilis]|nr:branched-chain alpha-keto acid dehydrogenase subunit E2 [Nitrococcus mobilis]